MSDEFSSINEEFIPLISSRVVKKISDLVKRGLGLTQEVKDKQITVLSATVDDLCSRVWSDFLKEITKNKCDLKFLFSFDSEEILNLADKKSIDVFILVIGNIVFRDDYTNDRYLENSLQLITHIKKVCEKPVIVVSSCLLIESPLIAQVRIAGNFHIQIPVKADAFRDAFNKCLDMLSDFEGNSRKRFTI
ncbi:hypothetical protein HGB07_00905 [Candidatus Roizmanbacteria bacterium]|nr:hypothetical protein [Candidatus Roizmanbacteria bacterium]